MGAFLIDLLQILFFFFFGGIIGFIIARKYMMKYIQENPPINEQMIKTMMTQMGRTPSQKQVNQMMKAMSKQMK